MSQPTRQPEKHFFDFELFLSLIFHGKTIILVSLIVTVGLAVIFSFAAPQQFQATAKILAEPGRQTNPYLLEAMSHQDRARFIETQKELVVSSTVLRSAISTFSERPADTITERDIDEFAKKVGVRSRSGMREALFSSDGIGESNSFFVTVTAQSPEDAEEMAKALVDAYLKSAANVRKEQALTAYQMIQQTVEETRARTKKAHQELVDFESEAGELLPELLNVDKPTQRVFPELEDIRAEYQKSKVELSGLKATAEELRKVIDGTEEGEAPTVPSDLLNANPTLQLLRQKEVEFTMQLTDILPFYTEDAREVQSLRQKISLTRGEILAELEKMHKSAQSKAAILSVVQTSREEALAEYQEKLSQLSRKNSRYSELKREYSTLAGTLESQMQTLSEALAAANEQRGGANIAVIDPASASYKPVAPKPVRNIVLSIPLGFAIGLVLTFLGFMTRPVFLHPRQVTAITGLPVVGMLHHKEGSA